MTSSAPHIPEALTSPSLNRGTAFDAEQRRALGLTGRLPSAVLTLEDQAQRLWQQLQSLPTDLARDLLLEVLYFTVLSEHLPELLPVVYDPTVGAPIEQYSDAYRGQRGVYLSIDRPDEIAESFKTFGLGPDAGVIAAVYSGLKVAGTAMADQRLVVFGSGTAVVGIADQLRDAMIADGATQEQATTQVWLVDKQGLLFDDRDELRDFQQPYAKNRKHLGVRDNDRVGLVETIKMASATILLGTSTVHGAFTRDVIEAMAASTERPLIFTISNPTEKIEAIPADVLNWSNGKALVATGIPVDPEQHNRTTYEIRQANNFLAVGLSLGVIVAGAQRVTKAMLEAAAKAVADQADIGTPGAALLPNVKNLRALSAVVAEAVYGAAHADGVATKKPDDVVQAIADTVSLRGYDEGSRHETR
jgi:malic enzyme